MDLFRCSNYRFRHPRSRPDLWQRRHAPIARHGHPDKPTALVSPLLNGFAEPLIGSIRRECADYIIVLGEMHLRRVMKSYADYYNCFRTHRSLNKMRRFLARSANRCDQFTRHPGRTSSTLRLSLGFRYTQVLALVVSGLRG
jgi:Integrase core domain